MQYYKLYFVGHTCGHTRSLKSISELTRQELYRLAAEPCPRCLVLRGGVHTGPVSDQARTKGHRRQTITTARRYEEAYQELCRMYLAGRVPVDVFADSLGITPSTTYKGLAKYADITPLRVYNGWVFSAGRAR